MIFVLILLLVDFFSRTTRTNRYYSPSGVAPNLRWVFFASNLILVLIWYRLLCFFVSWKRERPVLPTGRYRNAIHSPFSLYKNQFCYWCFPRFLFLFQISPPVLLSHKLISLTLPCTAPRGSAGLYCIWESLRALYHVSSPGKDEQRRRARVVVRGLRVCLPKDNTCTCQPARCSRTPVCLHALRDSPFSCGSGVRAGPFDTVRHVSMHQAAAAAAAGTSRTC